MPKFEATLKEPIIIEIADHKLGAYEALSEYLEELVEQAKEAEFTLGTDLIDIFEVKEIE